MLFLLQVQQAVTPGAGAGEENQGAGCEGSLQTGGHRPGPRETVRYCCNW